MLSNILRFPSIVETINKLPVSELIFGFLLSKNFQIVDELLSSMLDSGIISRDDYEKIVREIARLMWMKGKEYEEKAKEIAKMIELSIVIHEKPQKPTIEFLLMKRQFDKLQNFLDSMLDSGIISRDDYEKIVREIARLMWMKGKEYEEKAKEIAKMIERICGNKNA